MVLPCASAERIRASQSVQQAAACREAPIAAACREAPIAAVYQAQMKGRLRTAVGAETRVVCQAGSHALEATEGADCPAVHVLAPVIRPTFAAGHRPVAGAPTGAHALGGNRAFGRPRPGTATSPLTGSFPRLRRRGCTHRTQANQRRGQPDEPAEDSASCSTRRRQLQHYRSGGKGFNLLNLRYITTAPAIVSRPYTYAVLTLKYPIPGTGTKFSTLKYLCYF